MGWVDRFTTPIAYKSIQNLPRLPANIPMRLNTKNTVSLQSKYTKFLEVIL